MTTFFFPIKELNREEPAGIGRPSSERYVLDFRGALVERKAIVSRERLSLSHCLALSTLIKLMSKLNLLLYGLYQVIFIEHLPSDFNHSFARISLFAVCVQTFVHVTLWKANNNALCNFI